MTDGTANAPWASSIDAYLAELKKCLKGQPAALIQDALADASEYLRDAAAEDPDATPEQTLARVAELYGSPQEVAQEYIKMERSVQSPFPNVRDDDDRESGGGFFGVLIDPRAYGAFIYMLLSLATGVFYFTWGVTGVALTIGFAILIIGIPFALLFLGSIRVIGWIEGRLVEALLGVRMPRRLDVEPGDGGTIWERIKAMLVDGRTWSSLIYMLLMLPLGVVYSVIAIVGGSLSLACLTAPLGRQMIQRDFVHIDLRGLNDELNLNWNLNLEQLNQFLNSDAGLALLAVIGFFMTIVMLHIARAIGYLHGKLAEALLVRL
jgi:uncharacterized membrane protein